MDNKRKDILDNLKLKETGFSLPKNYFMDFESDFYKNNNKISTGFKTPYNYFNELEDVIIQKNNFNKTGFKTPSNYFETIEANVLDEINSAKVIPLNKHKTLKMISFAVAASFILFFSIYDFNANKNNLSSDTVKISEIENWMDDDLITFNTYEISEIFTDNDLDLADNDADVILDYFEYIDIDDLIFEN